MPAVHTWPDPLVRADACAEELYTVVGGDQGHKETWGGVCTACPARSDPALSEGHSLSPRMVSALQGGALSVDLLPGRGWSRTWTIDIGYLHQRFDLLDVRILCQVMSRFQRVMRRCANVPYVWGSNEWSRPNGPVPPTFLTCSVENNEALLYWNKEGDTQRGYQLSWRLVKARGTDCEAHAPCRQESVVSSSSGGEQYKCFIPVAPGDERAVQGGALARFGMEVRCAYHDDLVGPSQWMRTVYHLGVDTPWVLDILQVSMMSGYDFAVCVTGAAAPVHDPCGAVIIALLSAWLEGKMGTARILCGDCVFLCTMRGQKACLFVKSLGKRGCFTLEMVHMDYSVFLIPDEDTFQAEGESPLRSACVGAAASPLLLQVLVRDLPRGRGGTDAVGVLVAYLSTLFPACIVDGQSLVQYDADGGCLCIAAGSDGGKRFREAFTLVTLTVVRQPPTWCVRKSARVHRGARQQAGIA